MQNMKLIAIDPSLTQSGWSLFSVEKEVPLAYGVIRPEPEKGHLGTRLLSLQTQIKKLFLEQSLKSGDILVCEGPAPITLNPSSSIKVEQVRGIFETLARDMGLLVPGRVNPRTVQTELLGLHGKQRKREEVKEVARRVVKSLIGICPDKESMEQDIVDSILIGVISISRVKRANMSGMELVEIFSERGMSSSRNGQGRGLRWAGNANLKFK